MTENDAAETASAFRLPMLLIAAFACAALCIALGVVVIGGWCIQNEELMSVLPGYVSMKANTAICFLFAGLGLALSLRPSARSLVVANLLSMLVMLIGTLTLLEYLAGLDLQIDRLFFADHTQLIFPGRMAWITSVNFCLSGASLLCLNVSLRTRLFSQAMAIVLLIDSLVAIAASLYGVKVLYGAIGYNSMALHTGVGFLILATGLVLAQPDSRLLRVISAPHTGGRLARMLLPVILLSPVAMGAIYLFPSLNFDQPRFGMALMAVTLSIAGSAALCILAAFLNRSDRQQAEILRIREESAAAVRKSERELRLLTDRLPSLLSYIDTGMRFLRVNRAYEMWTGMAADAIVGKTIGELLGEAYCQRTSFAFEAVLRGETVIFETAYPSPQGNCIAEVTYAPDSDESGRVRGVACMVMDLDERRKIEQGIRDQEKLQSANRVLHELATTDELTGMRNRRAFEDRLHAEFALSLALDRPLSLILIDIDNFKLRNDSWGHAAGDEVLRALGTLLISALRGPDLAARYGGEEFAILLPGNNRDQAAVVATRIGKLVDEKQWSNGAVTLSMGISTRNAEIPTEEELMRSADAALYEAKRTGKNRFCHWSRDLGR